MTEMTLTGRLEESPLAEVAGELFRRKQTGRLLLASRGRSRQIIFYEGNPVAVLSDSPEDHVAHFLTVKGKVTQEEGARLQELPETKESLQSADFLTRDTLMWGLKFRFVNLAYDLFRWEEGTWTFEEGGPPRDIFLMKVPTPTLLSKGVHHMSPSLLMKRMPSDGVIASGPLPREEATGLTDEEEALLKVCSEGRKVQEIMEAEVADPVRTRELLYILVALGLVSAVPAPSATPVPEPSPPEAEAEEPTPEEPQESFEIERHTYVEAAPAGTGETGGGEPSLPPTDEEPPPEEPAPPQGLEMPEPLQPLVSEEEPEPPPLEMPPPPGGHAVAPASEESSMFIDPDAEPPGGAGAEPEPPGLDMPPTPPTDLPPPPWQEAADTTSGEGALPGGKTEAAGAARSPFAPPGASPEAEGRISRTRPTAAKAPKRGRAVPSRLFLLFAAVGAAVLIGAGVYVGSKSFRSPSTPLPPIPPAEEAKPELAEDLPVPALPSTAEKATEEPLSDRPAALPDAPVPVPAPEPSPPPEPSPAPPAAAAVSYESGLALFESGDYQGAASVWHEVTAASDASHSVSVVVACQIDTVKNAFASYGSGRQIFAVPLKLRDGRACYRVCMGLFDSKADAQAAIDSLPSLLRGDLSVRTVKSLL